MQELGEGRAEIEGLSAQQLYATSGANYQYWVMLVTYVADKIGRRKAHNFKHKLNVSRYKRGQLSLSVAEVYALLFYEQRCSHDMARTRHRYIFD
jgi:hypothetical protein